jgi:hypothetical protein
LLGYQETGFELYLLEMVEPIRFRQSPEEAMIESIKLITQDQPKEQPT